jgi:hypothetical protein
MPTRKTVRPVAVPSENLNNNKPAPKAVLPRRGLTIREPAKHLEEVSRVDPSNADDLVTPAYVCERLKISRKTLYRMNRQNPPVLPIIRTGPNGRTIRYRNSSFQYYLATREVKGASVSRLQAFQQQSRAAQRRKNERKT